MGSWRAQPSPACPGSTARPTRVRPAPPLGRAGLPARPLAHGPETTPETTRLRRPRGAAYAPPLPPLPSRALGGRTWHRCTRAKGGGAHKLPILWPYTHAGSIFRMRRAPRSSGRHGAERDRRGRRRRQQPRPAAVPSWRCRWRWSHRSQTHLPGVGGSIPSKHHTGEWARMGGSRLWALAIGLRRGRRGNTMPPTGHPESGNPAGGLHRAHTQRVVKRKVTRKLADSKTRRLL